MHGHFGKSHDDQVEDAVTEIAFGLLVGILGVYVAGLAGRIVGDAFADLMRERRAKPEPEQYPGPQREPD